MEVSCGKQLLKWFIVVISKTGFLGIFYKCSLSVTELHCHCLHSDRDNLFEREYLCISNLKLTSSPMMALMGFSFPSFNIPSVESFKPMLQSVGILREAGTHAVRITV